MIAMQQTRLNTLLNTAGSRLTEFFGNPWRRISLILISLLFGMFMGQAIPTTTGQNALWDVEIAALILFAVETASRFAYQRQAQKSFWINVLNVFKMGLTYGLFLEAFKLGS